MEAMRRPRARGHAAPGGVSHAGAFAAALGAALLLAACSDLHIDALPTVGSDAGDPVVAMPSFRTDIQPIFTARCAVAGCHITPTQANLGLVLTDAVTSRAHLVNVDSIEIPGILRVAPSDSANSYLMLKLDAFEMPKAGPPLSQGTRDTIRNWIDQGALDN
jgi:hypothetical protein